MWQEPVCVYLCTLNICMHSSSGNNTQCCCFHRENYEPWSVTLYFGSHKFVHLVRRVWGWRHQWLILNQCLFVPYYIGEFIQEQFVLLKTFPSVLPRALLAAVTCTLGHISKPWKVSLSLYPCLQHRHIPNIFVIFIYHKYLSLFSMQSRWALWASTSTMCSVQAISLVTAHRSLGFALSPEHAALFMVFYHTVVNF